MMSDKFWHNLRTFDFCIVIKYMTEHDWQWRTPDRGNCVPNTLEMKEMCLRLYYAVTSKEKPLSRATSGGFIVTHDGEISFNKIRARNVA